MDHAIAGDERLKRNPIVVLREEDEDGGLLFNPDNNEVRVVNATGLFIWKQFENIITPAEVAGAVRKNFEASSMEVVQSDLVEFLQELLACGFINEVKNE